jgi:prevent-host-death family protein
MEQVNVHEAKTHLSKLLERVEAGEEIVIARNGKPVAKLVAAPARKPRVPGALKGRIWISDDFDEPDQEIVDSFYGGDDPFAPPDDEATRDSPRRDSE